MYPFPPTDNTWKCPFPCSLDSIRLFSFLQTFLVKRNHIFLFNISSKTSQTVYLFKCLSAICIYFSVPTFAHFSMSYLIFTFCFVRPLCILRILILFMWCTYFLPVTRLSYKFIYIVFFIQKTFGFYWALCFHSFFSKASGVPVFLWKTSHPPSLLEFIHSGSPESPGLEDRSPLESYRKTAGSEPGLTCPRGMLGKTRGVIFSKAAPAFLP